MLSLHLSERLVSKEAGNHSFKVLIVVRLIHPCSTSTGKEFHMVSKSVVWVAPVGAFVPDFRLLHLFYCGILPGQLSTTSFIINTTNSACYSKRKGGDLELTGKTVSYNNLSS